MDPLVDLEKQTEPKGSESNTSDTKFQGKDKWIQDCLGEEDYQELKRLLNQANIPKERKELAFIFSVFFTGAQALYQGVSEIACFSVVIQLIIIHLTFNMALLFEWFKRSSHGVRLVQFSRNYNIKHILELTISYSTVKFIALLCSFYISALLFLTSFILHVNEVIRCDTISSCCSESFYGCAFLNVLSSVFALVGFYCNVTSLKEYWLESVKYIVRQE